MTTTAPGLMARPVVGAAVGLALVERAEAAYAEAIGNNPQYPAWLTDHGQRGV
ncbi:MAG: hypothetical protein ACRDP3_18820 [Streptomyces sp.]|uniref:hypothetical protein n=1 Tax=Streptomyces sp. TaxID=1931 RepID=UPI003D6AF7A8